MKPLLVLVLAFLVVGVLLKVSPIQAFPTVPTVPCVTFTALADNSTNATGNQTTPSVYTSYFTLDRSFYSPITVQLTYPYTHDHSISTITTIGQSYPKVTSDPVSLSFLATDTDRYSFTVTIRYEDATDTTILLAVTQGDMPVEGYTIRGFCDTFILNFQLNVSPEPHYPTDAEVAAEVVKQIGKTLQDQLTATQNLMNDLATSQLEIIVLVFICVILCLVTFVVVGVMARRRGRLHG